MSRLLHPVVVLALVACAASAFGQTTAGDPADGSQTTAPAEQATTESAAASTSGNSPAAGGQMAPGAVREPGTRLAAAVPAGMSAQEACAGFKGAAECATTLHAAHNLDIPFVDLKSKVTAGERLTSAVKELKPGVDAKAEVEKAGRQAATELNPPEG